MEGGSVEGVSFVLFLIFGLEEGGGYWFSRMFFRNNFWFEGLV